MIKIFNLAADHQQICTSILIAMNWAAALTGVFVGEVNLAVTVHPVVVGIEDLVPSLHSCSGF